MGVDINSDGSIKGSSFSEAFNGKKYEGEHPIPKIDDTYASFRKRVDEAKAKGFHLGDLGNSSWTYYCMGSGNYDDVDANTKIFGGR
jgi:hypothetical protein